MKIKLHLIITVVLLSINVFAQVPDNVPTNGLVGWWPFNGSANDESGNGYNGIVNSAAIVPDRNGIINSAYQFNGISSSIEINQIFDYSQRAINFWFFAESAQLTPNYNMFFEMNNAALLNGMWQFTVRIDSVGNPRLDFVDGHPGGTNGFQEGILLNTWYMVTISKSDSTRYFLNSQLVKTVVNGTVTSTAGNLPSVTTVGARVGGLSKFFDGAIDDIGIWNRYLTQQEISVLYLGCQLSVSTQPTNQSAVTGNNAQFTVSSNSINATFQWQTDLGLGFQNVSNAGQYSGATTNTLTITGVTLSNNNQAFRCILSENSCGDTTNTVTLSAATGIADVVNGSSISITPNPTNGMFIINFENKIPLGLTTLEIFNSLGQLIQSEQINNQTNTLRKQIDLTVAKGIYTVRLTTNGNVYSQKLIVK